MKNKNSVFIAKSLDGYIADRDGGIDWLNSIPNPDHNDLGYKEFIAQVDAIVMGRITFELVCSFDIDWPYNIPVFVLSNTLDSVAEDYTDKVELIKGSLNKILENLNSRGFNSLYIDGGKTIQAFLNEDLIDELIISTIPILLGGGIPLFSALPKILEFDHLKTEVLINEIVQSYYRRKI